MSTLYNQSFYVDIKVGSKKSAQQIIPQILDLIDCRSVVDVGCGTGEWLSVFMENGITDILGLDGEYVNKELLAIPENNFKAVNLSEPLEIKEAFDLAISVEVAEHLPESSSTGFVELLTNSSSVILFSAAIPHQGGTNHINEQWNDYWVKKFDDQGYVVIDFLRLQFWQNNQVAWWFKQNVLLFVEKSELSNYPKLSKLYDQNYQPPQLVHPEIFLFQVRENQEKQQILDRRIIKAALKIDNFLRRNLEKLIGRNA